MINYKAHLLLLLPLSYILPVYGMQSEEFDFKNRIKLDSSVFEKIRTLAINQMGNKGSRYKKKNKKKKKKKHSKKSHNHTSRSQNHDVCIFSSADQHTTTDDIFWQLIAKHEQTMPLLEHVLTEHQDIIKINAPNNKVGITPLQYAINLPTTQLCALLLAHGADPNSRGKFVIAEQTSYIPPLVIAASLCKIETAELLLKHGADVSRPAFYIPSGKKEYVLDAAACSFDTDAQLTEHEQRIVIDQPSMVEYLLLNGARDFSGNIVLHNKRYNTTCTLDLHDDNDYTVIKALLRVQNPKETIFCSDGAIKFIANDEEEERDDTINLESPD